MRWRWRYGKKVEFEYNVQQIIPIPVKNPEPIIITKEELEAMRLVDYEGLTQEEAGMKMGCSRPTISRLVNSARKKLIQAIIEGRPLKVE